MNDNIQRLLIGIREDFVEGLTDFLIQEMEEEQKALKRYMEEKMNLGIYTEHASFKNWQAFLSKLDEDFLALNVRTRSKLYEVRRAVEEGRLKDFVLTFCDLASGLAMVNEDFSYTTDDLDWLVDMAENEGDALAVFALLLAYGEAS